MLDIKWIRENPEALDAALKSRGADPAAAELVRLDEERRGHVARLQDLQSRRNDASKEIGKAKASGNAVRAEEVIAEVAEIKTAIQDGEAEERRIDAVLGDILARLPNIPLEGVPVGSDEAGNVEIRKHGTIPSFDFTPKQHFDLGEALGLMDFDQAVKISGARFTILKGALARLERALGQFMLDLHTSEHGYEEVVAPILVKPEALFGTNQLPKFEEDLFKTTDGRYLIPTSEVPLTNLVREMVLDEADLPLRYTALTPCFRSEAGSAGRDTRGMLRQHQFYKVELVSITAEDASLAEHERMTACAEEVLKRLGLAFRTVVLCTGDMGFGARKTHDIEVWMPGQNAYREISSCSVCGDFQARRMSARYKVAGEKQSRFVHTLNGSGVAAGRCLIAVMENFQNADGSITVPEVLRPYMGGVERIGAAA